MHARHSASASPASTSRLAFSTSRLSSDAHVASFPLPSSSSATANCCARCAGDAARTTLYSRCISLRASKYGRSRNCTSHTITARRFDMASLFTASSAARASFRHLPHGTFGFLAFHAFTCASNAFATSVVPHASPNVHPKSTTRLTMKLR